MLVLFTTVILSHAVAKKPRLLNKALEREVYAEAPHLIATDLSMFPIQSGWLGSRLCSAVTARQISLSSIVCLSLYIDRVIDFGLECMATLLEFLFPLRGRSPLLRSCRLFHFACDCWLNRFEGAFVFLCFGD